MDLGPSGNQGQEASTSTMFQCFSLCKKRPEGLRTKQSCRDHVVNPKKHRHRSMTTVYGCTICKDEVYRSEEEHAQHYQSAHGDALQTFLSGDVMKGCIPGCSSPAGTTENRRIAHAMNPVPHQERFKESLWLCDLCPAGTKHTYTIEKYKNHYKEEHLESDEGKRLLAATG